MLDIYHLYLSSISHLSSHLANQHLTFIINPSIILFLTSLISLSYYPTYIIIPHIFLTHCLATKGPRSKRSTFSSRGRVSEADKRRLHIPIEGGEVTALGREVNVVPL